MQDLIDTIEDNLVSFGDAIPDYPKRQLRQIVRHLRDPLTYESAIATTRKISEWYLKDLYASEIGKSADQIGHITVASMLSTLQRTTRPENLATFRILQGVQNYYSHAQSTTADISPHTVDACIRFVLPLLERHRADYGATFLNKKPLILALDVGTRKISTALVSLANPEKPEILRIKRVFHQEIASEIGLIDKLIDALASLVEMCGITFHDILAIGVGLPGQVDYRTGLLKFAPGLRLKGINISSRLSSELGVKVYADNDVNCSTLAEMIWGHGRNFTNFISIFVGNGIGAGLVFEGRIYRGSGLAAGEIGHMKIDWSDSARTCTCGAKGCFEEYASARAIVRLAREAIFDAREGLDQFTAQYPVMQ